MKEGESVQKSCCQTADIVIVQQKLVLPLNWHQEGLGVFEDVKDIQVT